jgi:hypothetical protein
VLHELRGWALLREGDAAAALVSFGNAVEHAEAYGTLDQQFAANWALARGLREVGRTAEAREIQRRLASERPDEPAVTAELEALSDAPDDDGREAAAPDDGMPEGKHTIES